MRYDWNAFRTQVLLNPRIPQNIDIEKLFDLEEHFWLMTSGSTGILKCVALSKDAVLKSAEAVNRHIGACSEDRWIHVLPDFHVGGLGIFARAHLSHSRVIALEERWNPHQFVKTVQTYSGTLTALVPAQVYDLVYNHLCSPPSLRAVIVGGGALSDQLYQKGMELGWPLMPSYGLTECGSQVATAKLESSKLIQLDHIESKVNDQGFLCIKSPSLLTQYAYFNHDGICFHDPKVDGWFTTEDRVKFDGDGMIVIGRQQDFIKIGGESVDLKRLESIIMELQMQLNIKHDLVLFAMPDERLDHVIHLAYTNSYQIISLVERYNASVLPYERIRKTHQVEQIPRTSLNKLELKKIISSLR